MRKKIFSKIFVILIITLLIISTNINIVLAKVNTNVEIGSRLIHEAEPIGNRITGALKVIGIFVAVGMTMIVGIKYMLCSVEEKAEYKKTAIAYLVGAILIFATTQLISFINGIVSSVPMDSSNNIENSVNNIEN